MFKKLLLIALLVQLAVSGDLKPNYGGTLIFARGGDATSLDPAHAADGESYYATRAVYNSLVEFEYGSTKIVPALAKSWKISEDGLTYTFYLKKGIHFAPTSYFDKSPELTSKDVVFSIKRQFDKSNPYHKIGGDFKFWKALNMDDIVKDVVAIDKYTVEFILKKPEAPFLADIAMDFMGILSFEYANFLLKDGKAEELEKFPVGTGPFIFLSWKKDDKIVFKANTNYWDGRPYLDKLVMKVMSNSLARANELKEGNIHIMDFPDPGDLKELEKDPNIKLIRQEGLTLGYLAYNTEKKPFNNTLVRQALNYAIDVKSIVKAVYGDLGKVATNALPPTIWSYDKNIKGYQYNPQKAKKLLKKAGYEDGFDIDIWAIPVPRAYNPNGRRTAEIIQKDLAKVGVKARIVSYDWQTYLKKVSFGEHDMALLGWTSDNADPDNFMYTLLNKNVALKKPSKNRAFWKNDAFSILTDKAKGIRDKKKREKLYKKAQAIFNEEAPWLPIAYTIVVEPMLKSVHGFKLDPTGKRRFKEVWLEK